MANNGELFVLDMGGRLRLCTWLKYDSVIGAHGIKIKTGLRPGEKLYEELLVKQKNWIKRKTV